MTRDDLAPRPLQVVVMGVSGAGKSSVATRLARGLGADVLEGDDHHSSGSIAKMAAGVALTDDDRGPWLDRLAAEIADRHARGASTVVACSALRRRYRDRLRSAAPAGAVVFLELDVDAATLRRRMASRDHFMPVELLASQLSTLEPLAADEPGVRLDGARPLDAVVADAASFVAAAARPTETPPDGRRTDR